MDRIDNISLAYPIDNALQTRRLRASSRRRPLSFDRTNIIPSEKHPALYAFSEGSSSPEDDEAQASTPNDRTSDGDALTQEIVDAAVSKLKKKFVRRITRLEDIVSRQEIEIYRLKQQCARLTQVSEAFSSLLGLLKEAGLDAEKTTDEEGTEGSSVWPEPKNNDRSSGSSNETDQKVSLPGRVVESYDDEVIFGTAPASVIDAADAAGAAILAAMLGGKQRMLVDVRDAELSTDPETLVQFIELAILPIAAGLEGLKSTRNRVKIVFPKVSQLLEYRRTMALAAPEVVALSTLGFDPVEKRDKLVVIVAPEPDDDEGVQAMRELLVPSDPDSRPIQQPVVILNYHMIPFQGLDFDFETAYHLRLLTVQYMSDGIAQEILNKFQKEDNGNPFKSGSAIADDNDTTDLEVFTDKGSDEDEARTEDEALESAMKHAHELGMHQGTTRAMVIRAYPRPWHVFVDLSPDTDADYEVAATFDEEPSLEQINYAIVECLEGSEVEDQIVAQQMQQALEEGQLNKVSDMISDALERFDDGEAGPIDMSDDEDDFDMFEEDSV
ncbi:DUF1995 domain containing protein [Nitzschia inconspicua]|uniref:DUF1995 domain containing protein n=1 Tax=Nitzschia inconspicua TaxID=303405 RepID=A0A9K3LN91_9STRA|nr:DUF1995 domain containing protein [Nitzschia inconspicua]